MFLSYTVYGSKPLSEALAVDTARVKNMLIHTMNIADHRRTMVSCESTEGEVQELLETRTPKMQKEFMLLFERRSLYQIQNKFHFSRHERGGEEKKGERELQYAEYLPDNAQKHASAYASAEYMFGTRWTERQKTA